jgi:hypothetical protein
LSKADRTVASGKKGRRWLITGKDGKIFTANGKSVYVREVDVTGKPYGPVRALNQAHINEADKHKPAQADAARADAPKFARDFDVNPNLGTVSGISDETEPVSETAESAVEGPTTMREAVKEGLNAVLNFIIEKSKTPGYPALAKRLLEVLGERNVTIETLTGDEMLKKFGNAKAKALH